MKKHMSDMIANFNIELIDALKMIDSNHKGFLVIVDFNNRIYGVLTDGDIRRYLLKTKDLFVLVSDVCVKEPYTLSCHQKIGDAIEIFKSEGIDFLPILSDDNTVSNIITKRQLEVLLLHNIHADLEFDFMKLNEQVLEHEIYYRPWGFFKTTMINDFFQSKMIVVYPNGKLSLQYHNHRDEYWVVVYGDGIVNLGDSLIEVKSGSTIFVPKGVKHRIANTSKCDDLVFCEVQIGDYFGEDDIIRLEDSYGREA